MRKALLRANLPFGGKASQPMSLDEYCFKHEPVDYNVYWDVRKGLIPIVGAARETGALGRLPRPKSLKGVGMTDTTCTGTCARGSSPSSGLLARWVRLGACPNQRLRRMQDIGLGGGHIENEGLCVSAQALLLDKCGTGP